MGYRLATKDDVGKEAFFTDDELGPHEAERDGLLRSIIDDGGKFRFASNSRLWRFAYVKEPEYRTPTVADIGKMVEVRDDNDRDWIVFRRLFGIFNGKFIVGRDGCDPCYFWDYARIKD